MPLRAGGEWRELVCNEDPDLRRYDWIDADGKLVKKTYQRRVQ